MSVLMILAFSYEARILKNVLLAQLVNWEYCISQTLFKNQTQLIKKHSKQAISRSEEEGLSNSSSISNLSRSNIKFHQSYVCTLK